MATMIIRPIMAIPVSAIETSTATIDHTFIATSSSIALYIAITEPKWSNVPFSPYNRRFIG
jgi:hypothetical protein